MAEERVWVRFLDSTLRFRCKNGKLDAGEICKKWKLDPESLVIGPDAIAVGDDGLSEVALVEIRQAASEVGAGDGSQDTPFLLKGAAPATPLPTAPAAEPLDLLLTRYREIASKSRARDSSTEEPEFDVMEPGANFDILGREGTYTVLLKAAGQMYANFLNAAASTEQTYRAMSFFLAMVAFPGAGKTTLGKRGWRFLVDSWKGMKQEKKVELLNGTFEDFNDLVEESVKFNLVLYHEVANDSGRILHEEEGLRVSHILGLRTLYMVIYPNDSRTSYASFLSDLDANLPGLKQHASFGLAIKFLSRVLDLKKRVMVTFFYDEVNAINATLSGATVEEKGKTSTWFQELMSEYVHENFLLAEARTSLVFPIFSIATTRFSAGDLQFTVSRKSTSVLIPMPPLTMEESERVVLRYLQRLATRLQLPSPAHLTGAAKLMIRLSGGMPRYISQGLRALGKSATSLNKLLEGCVRERNGLDLEIFLEDWRELLLVRSSYAKYQNPNMYPDVKVVLKKAVAAAVLGKVVKRKEEVVPGGVKWWELEWSGAAALTAVSSLETDDPGEGEGYVKLCPLVVEALVKNESIWPVLWPPVSEPGWNRKEVADALSVMLRAFLLHEEYQEDEFRVSDIVPPGTIIPSALEHLRFKMEPVQCLFGFAPHPHKDTDLRQLRKHGTSGVLGPGNFAADWYIFLDGITIMGQSKLSLHEDNVTIGHIMKSFEKDVGKFFNLPAVSPQGKQALQEASTERANTREQREEGASSRPKRQCTLAGKRLQADELVRDKLRDAKKQPRYPDWLTKLPVLYFFCSTKPIPDTTLCSLETLQDVHAWARHLVVFHEGDAVIRNDALSVLSLIRKVPLL